MSTNQTNSDTNSVFPPTSTTDASSAELIAAVDDLLKQVGTKFNNISQELLGKMDDMSRRLDNLEASIQAGGEQGKGPGPGK